MFLGYSKLKRFSGNAEYIPRSLPEVTYLLSFCDVEHMNNNKIGYVIFN